MFGKLLDGLLPSAEDFTEYSKAASIRFEIFKRKRDGAGAGACSNHQWGVGRRLHQTIRLFIYHFLAPKGPKAGGQELEVSQIQVPLANGAGRAGTRGRAISHKTGEGNYILGLV